MKPLILIISFFNVLCANAQSSYWQQEVNFKIEVELDTKQKSLQGHEVIEYINNSPDTLRIIDFHLYANAYKSENSAFVKQLFGNPEMKLKWALAKRGYVDGLNFKVDGKTVTIKKDLQNEDMISLNLNSPLLPNKKIMIETSFYVQLPSFISRSGYVDEFYSVCQWYPKPALYDRYGWHNFPYLMYGEYFSDYGSYEVKITVPSNFIVAATGVLNSKEEVQQLKQIGKWNTLNPKKQKIAYKTKKGVLKKTLLYKAENLPDFAWFADPDFVVLYDTVQLKSRNIIDVFSFHHQLDTAWKKTILYAKDALIHYSNWVGEYKYPVVSVVEGFDSPGVGGMEYPMITLITYKDPVPRSLDFIITHEIGHNWFMSMIGSNERDFPWLDEGLNSFFEIRYQAEKYKFSTWLRGDDVNDISTFQDLTAIEIQKAIYEMMNENMRDEDVAIQKNIDQPYTDAWFFHANYVKTPFWLSMIEDSIGAKKMDEAMHLYFERWCFKHPYPSDFQKVLEEVSARSMHSLFALLKQTGRLRPL